MPGEKTFRAELEEASAKALTAVLGPPGTPETPTRIALAQVIATAQAEVVAEAARLHEADVAGLRARVEVAEAQRDEARATKDMHKERQQEAWAKVKRLREALERIAEVDCTYGDNCPAFGTRHGMCLPCIARKALASQGGERVVVTAESMATIADRLEQPAPTEALRDLMGAQGGEVAPEERICSEFTYPATPGKPRLAWCNKPLPCPDHPKPEMCREVYPTGAELTTCLRHRPCPLHPKPEEGK